MTNPWYAAPHKPAAIDPRTAKVGGWYAERITLDDRKVMRRESYAANRETMRQINEPEAVSFGHAPVAYRPNVVRKPTQAELDSITNYPTKAVKYCGTATARGSHKPNRGGVCGGIASHMGAVPQAFWPR